MRFVNLISFQLSLYGILNNSVVTFITQVLTYIVLGLFYIGIVCFNGRFFVLFGG